MIKDILIDIPLKGGMLDRKSIDLPGIFDRTLDKIKGNIVLFDCSSKELERARSRLGNFLPYTDNYRCLLNAAILEERNALSTFAQKRLGQIEKAGREYEYLVLDCLRLCYLNMRYRIGLETMKAEREAKEELLKTSQEQGA
jgi:hypothetical protein